MTNQTRIVVKAETPEIRSDAIVVSFDHIWYEPLRRRGFSAIIRRRVPTTFQPKWLYFHINFPKSAICARASLKGVDRLDLRSAIGMKNSLALSEDAIVKYFGRLDSIGVYFLIEIELAGSEVSTRKLSESLIYHPPQSFVTLSRPAKVLIDDACGFKAAAQAMGESADGLGQKGG